MYSVDHAGTIQPNTCLNFCCGTHQHHHVENLNFLNLLHFFIVQ